MRPSRAEALLKSLDSIVDRKEAEEAERAKRCATCEGLAGGEYGVTLPDHLKETYHRGHTCLHCKRCDLIESVNIPTGILDWCIAIKKLRFKHAHCGEGDGTCPALRAKEETRGSDGM